jgi:adenylate cyclase class 1
MTSNLSGCSFENVKFMRCRFVNVDFSKARFNGVRFLGCTFKNCLFTDSAFSKSIIRRSHMELCIFSGSSFRGVKLLSGSISASDLHGVSFQFSNLAEMKITASNFSGARFKNNQSSGTTWRDCLLRDIFMEGGSFRSTLFIACEVKDICLHAVETDVPLLIKHSELGQDELLRSILTKAFQDTSADSGPSLALSELTPQDESFKTYTAYLYDSAYSRDILRRGAAMQERDELRTAWGLAKMGAEKAVFAAMLPLLVELDAVIDENGVSPAPACSIAGYAPDYDAAAALAKHFSAKDLKAMREKAGPKHSKQSPIPVDGLYSIGSIGTVAQTASSDIDLWLCVDGSIVDADSLERLKTKLLAVERFADEVYDLEVHFFVMNLQDVRQNNFGFTDKESAGSSQAKLLKEEFYRTVIHTAGRKPAWWYLPPNVDGPKYARHLERFSKLLPNLYKDTADLGPLESVDYKEFFGAAMWQIIKALKSPFKSVLKFGLMESYFKTGGQQTGVADTIKERIQDGDRDFWNLDAYAVLFKRLYDHYHAQKDERAIELMRLSYIQRTGMNASVIGAMETISGHDGAAMMEYFFPASPADMERKLLSASADVESVSRLKNFDAFQKVGAEVGRYMFQSYEMVSSALRDKSSEAAISAEDMTKLGRKLISCLQPKKNKITRVPFIHSPKGIFASLDISCESEAGKKPVWIVKAYTKASDGEKGGVEEIRRDESLYRLTAWLTTNKLYTPKTHWQSASLKDPISYADIDLLLRSMYDFLPPATVFEPEFDEYMEAEQVLYAFLPVNFFTFRSMEKIREAGLIYVTNWGEMFSIQAPKKPELIAGKVSDFIKANAHVPPHPSMKQRTVAPQKSALARRTPEKVPA